MAIFKRCTTLLILDHRVVFRLPSERVNKEIFVYDEDGRKEYYGKFLEGENEEYEGYREAKQQEYKWATSDVIKVNAVVAALITNG